MQNRNNNKLLKLLAVFSLLSVVTPSMAFDGSVTYERFARLNTPDKKVDATDWIGAELDTDAITEVFDYHVDAGMRFYTESSDLNYSVQEAYAQYSGENHHVAFGRKISDWAPHQTYWQLNYLNPQKGFNLLSKEQEGLTGLHYGYRPNKTGFQFSSFISYFYVPTLNPNIDIENGSVSSTSEWQILPPSQTVVQGRTVPINYSLNMPAASDIVIQKSLGLNLGYSWRSGKIQAYATYKPESNVRANAEAFYDIASDEVKVTAEPIVNHHLLLGASIFQNFQGINYSAGIDVVDPNAKIGEDFDSLGPLQLERNNRTFDSEFFTIQPSYDRESYGYLSASLDRRRYNLSVNYTRLLSSNVRAQDDFFSDTVKFKSAIGFEVGFWLLDDLRIQGDLKYDFDRKDNILSGLAKYQFSETMSFAMGLELIKAPQDNSFWGPYRDNDTVYGTFGYHF